MPLRVLTICQHGNIRSVALAYLLKTIFKHNAIAIGIEETDKETRERLYFWSDRIICMDQGVWTFVRSELLTDGRSTEKVDLCDVGKDIWHDANAEELRHKILKNLRNLHIWNDNQSIVPNVDLKEEKKSLEKSSKMVPSLSSASVLNGRLRRQQLFKEPSTKLFVDTVER